MIHLSLKLPRSSHSACSPLILRNALGQIQADCSFLLDWNHLTLFSDYLASSYGQVMDWLWSKMAWPWPRRVKLRTSMNSLVVTICYHLHYSNPLSGRCLYSYPVHIYILIFTACQIPFSAADGSCSVPVGKHFSVRCPQLRLVPFFEALEPAWSHALAMPTGAGLAERTFPTKLPGKCIGKPYEI